MLRLIALQSVFLTAKLLLSEGEQDVPLHVTGVMNLSVDLSQSVDGTCSVSGVYWNFQTYIMASYINLHLNIIKEQFHKRLEMLHNGTSLRIRHLRMEDSGLYTVSITCTDGEQHHSAYNVTVFEPVPVPAIRIELVQNTTNWCNVTLHCSVPTNTSALSYTWRYKDSEYQLYNNGPTIQVSLQPAYWNMELLCLVHNPADQKNSSIHVQKICPDLAVSIPNKTGIGREYYATLSIFIMIILVLLLGWFLYKKKKRKKEPIVDPPEDIHYADLTLRSQTLCSQTPDRKSAENDFPLKTSEATIYSVLREGGV